MVKLDQDSPWKLCNNGELQGVCNWVISRTSDGLCTACQLNRTIPDLSFVNNLSLWRKMERAKRRTCYWLMQHHLPLRSKTIDPQGGLAFDFLQPQNGAPVITGHDQGSLTFNLNEADDSYREGHRQQLGEPYRTLLGHFCHEVAHYYWWLWFDQGCAAPEWLNAVREVFGDDTQDYTTALNNHYQNGPPPGWATSHISAYATSHPWEDWAETWAHYMHTTAALETARCAGLICQSDTARWQLEPSHVQLPAPFDSETGTEILQIVQDWMLMAPALNEMSLSLGHSDLYPFSPTPAVVRKLHLIHVLIQQAKSTTPPAP